MKTTAIPFCPDGIKRAFLHAEGRGMVVYRRYGCRTSACSGLVCFIWARPGASGLVVVLMVHLCP